MISCDSAGSYIRAGSAMFFAETEGELTLGSSTAFAAGFVWRGFRTKQSNTPSVSPQKRRRSTFLREEGFKKTPFIIDRVKAKQQFICFPTRRKSAFRSANNEMTGGLVSGGALKCGEHYQAPSHEVSRAYKRRFIVLMRLPYTAMRSAVRGVE